MPFISFKTVLKFDKQKNHKNPWRKASKNYLISSDTFH